MNLIRFTVAALCLLAGIPVKSQQPAEADLIRKVFNEALTSYEAYHNLEWLCKNTAGRICGTPEAAEAVEFTRQLMNNMKLDSVWLQPIMVKSWKRGEKEVARIVSDKFGTISVPSCALGWSVGTGDPGLSARVVEVKSLEELKSKPVKEIEGRIVFFNQPMKQTNLGTFSSYGEAVWQRVDGPVEAAKLGAAGCVIRSMSIEIDDFPHTGITRYVDDVKQIPAIALSTKAAEMLSDYLTVDPDLYFFFRTTCLTGPDVPSFNVIGEIRGSAFPNEIITIGGHLDAWDIAEGAHDDGGGCIQSIEVLRLFQIVGIRPEHTIRAVMFKLLEASLSQRTGDVLPGARRSDRIAGTSLVMAKASLVIERT